TLYPLSPKKLNKLMVNYKRETECYPADLWDITVVRQVNYKRETECYPADLWDITVVRQVKTTNLDFLDLKDAFFCIPIHEASQKFFAFEWESPRSGRKTQLTWTVLMQGFKNSPTLFGEQLTKDLESWKAPPEEERLLQYVDDLLIATKTKEACVAWTVSLLNFLGLQGYWLSKKVAQVMKQKVIYLVYEISAGQQTLGQSHKEAICHTPKPQTTKDLQTFLGMTGWCRLWIYNYGLLVKPLYALIANGGKDLQWTKEANWAYKQLKKALMSALALGLPDEILFLDRLGGKGPFGFALLRNPIRRFPPKFALNQDTRTDLLHFTLCRCSEAHSKPVSEGLALKVSKNSSRETDGLHLAFLPRGAPNKLLLDLGSVKKKGWIISRVQDSFYLRGSLLIVTALPPTGLGISRWVKSGPGTLRVVGGQGLLFLPVGMIDMVATRHAL
ncbi:hypothetical protein HGM15179_018533, partial [Zosterops borbonicus]